MVSKSDGGFVVIVSVSLKSHFGSLFGSTLFNGTLEKLVIMPA